MCASWLTFVAWWGCTVSCLAEGTTYTSPNESHTSPTHDVPQNSTLVMQLRRQLMENNYDYMPSESEEPFNRKAVEDDLLASTSPATAPAPAERTDTRLDKTDLEFDLQFNNPNKEFDNNNNVNTENEEKFISKLTEPKKEYDDLDRDYTDLKRKHDEIEQQLIKNKIDKEYATLKKEHDKVNAVHDRDPPNREYDDDNEKSNQMHLDDTRDGKVSESDINHSYERRNTKHGKLHKLNDKMKEKLKIHHNENENDIKRIEYMKYNNDNNNNIIREVDVDKQLGYMRAAGAGGAGGASEDDGNSNGPRYKQKDMEKEMGFLPRAHDDARGDDDSSGMSKKHGVHKNDLLYYMNDDRLKRAERNYLDLSNAGDDGDTGTSGANASDDYNDRTTVKYSLFTVVSAGGGRRAGSSGGRRAFVREQRPGEVVVLRLDDQPFPQFRLPAGRRQYMHSAEDKH